MSYSKEYNKYTIVIENLPRMNSKYERVPKNNLQRSSLYDHKTLIDNLTDNHLVKKWVISSQHVEFNYTDTDHFYIITTSDYIRDLDMIHMFSSNLTIIKHTY